MDLRIKGRHAIVCASRRKGSGRSRHAAPLQLANEGVHSHAATIARRAEALKKTADENLQSQSRHHRHRDRRRHHDACMGREAALKACPDPDISINNAGGLPPGDFPQLDPRRLDQG